MSFLRSFSLGHCGEGDQVTVYEALPEIVRPIHVERFTAIHSLHSHPDKVKLAINQTMDEVAAKFVKITKAYKSSVWLLLCHPSFLHISPLRLTAPTIRENYEKYGHFGGRKEMFTNPFPRRLTSSSILHSSFTLKRRRMRRSRHSRILGFFLAT